MPKIVWDPLGDLLRGLVSIILGLIFGFQVAILLQGLFPSISADVFELVVYLIWMIASPIIYSSFSSQKKK
jgi:hypothetical protein